MNLSKQWLVSAENKVDHQATFGKGISGTPTLDQAVELIQEEVDFCLHYLPDINQGLIYSLSMLSYTVGHVSAPRYGKRVRDDLPTPRQDNIVVSAEDALRMEAGICGHAANVMYVLSRRIGLPVRFVQLFYGEGDKAGGHIFVETSWGNEWHHMDGTWGTYFIKDGRYLNTKEILDLSDTARQNAKRSDVSLPWRWTAEHSGNLYGVGLTAFKERPLRVVYDLDPATTVIYQ